MTARLTQGELCPVDRAAGAAAGASHGGLVVGKFAVIGPEEAHRAHVGVILLRVGKDLGRKGGSHGQGGAEEALGECHGSCSLKTVFVFACAQGKQVVGEDRLWDERKGDEIWKCSIWASLST